jgi:hypothetical protein
VGRRNSHSNSTLRTTTLPAMQTPLGLVSPGFNLGDRQGIFQKIRQEEAHRVAYRREDLRRDLENHFRAWSCSPISFGLTLGFRLERSMELHLPL